MSNDIYDYETVIMLNDLKNRNDNFNLAYSIVIKFNDKRYGVVFKELKCYKYYNEKISQEEINTFVNAIMKDILQQIKQATNQ